MPATYPGAQVLPPPVTLTPILEGWNLDRGQGMGKVRRPVAAQQSPELSQFRCTPWPGEVSLFSSPQTQKPGTWAAGQSQLLPDLCIVHVAAASASHRSLLTEGPSALRSDLALSLWTKHKACSGGGEDGDQHKEHCKARLPLCEEAPRTLI